MSDVGTSIKDGLGAGLIAGAIFGVSEIAAAAVAGHPPVWVLREMASVVLGAHALTSASTAMVVVVGLIAHAYLSAMFGLGYGLYNSALTPRTRIEVTRQAAVGGLFGVVLWLVNGQIFARVNQPWLLELPQLPQLALHALAFGVPLGLLYGRAEAPYFHGPMHAPMGRGGTR